MEDKVCPLCGKPISDHNTFCKDCREMAKDEFTDYLLHDNATNEISSQDVSLYIDEIGENKDIDPEINDPNYALLMQKRLSDKKAQNKRKRSIILFIIGLVILVIVGGIGSHIFKQEKESEKVEIAFWNDCLKEDTPLSYSKYLVRFPNGQFNEQAEERIFYIRKQEQDAWDSIQASTSINTYLAFNEKYPKSPYKDFIVSKIDSIAWFEAKAINTIEAYHLYLQKADSGIYIGKYAPNAKKEYDYLSQFKEVEEKALNEIKRNMNNLAQLLSQRKYENASKLVAPILTNYLGTPNKETKNIISDIKKYDKENKIKSTTYIFKTDSIQVFQDNNNIFLFDIPASIRRAFIDKKKKSENKEYILSIELDNKMKIQSIYLKNNH